MRRFDKYWIGILLGLIIPILFGLLYVHRMNLYPILRTLGWGALGTLPTRLVTLAAFPDMALLFLFYTTESWRLCRGLLFSTFLYLFLAVILTL